jgi:hypothetical protein
MTALALLKTRESSLILVISRPTLFLWAQLPLHLDEPVKTTDEIRQCDEHFDAQLTIATLAMFVLLRVALDVFEQLQPLGLVSVV